MPGLAVQLRGLLPVLVQPWQCRFVLGEFEFQLLDARAIAKNVFRAEELMERFDARFALSNFGFDFSRLAIGELALAALLGWPIRFVARSRCTRTGFGARCFRCDVG